MIVYLPFISSFMILFVLLWSLRRIKDYDVVRGTHMGKGTGEEIVTLTLKKYIRQQSLSYGLQFASIIVLLAQFTIISFVAITRYEDQASTEFLINTVGGFATNSAILAWSWNLHKETSKRVNEYILEIHKNEK